MILSALHCYPVKSIGGNVLQSAVVEPRGLRGDRRWMIVDDHGKCITGREHGTLTQVRATLDGDALTLHAPGCAPVRVEAERDAARLPVTVWKSNVHAAPANAAADAWISAWLGRPARLVFMDDGARRPVNPDHGRPGDEVSFADGYPLLLVSQAALDHLNAKLPQPVSMQNFRPNLVVHGTVPHAEDGWRRIRIGEVEFDVVKPCTRCVFTTVDPATGERDSGGEPLRTLIGYRRTSGGVTFGQNLIPRSHGTVHVGDTVTILA